MNSIRRTLAPLAIAFAAFALVPAVAHAQGMPDLKDAKHEKAHDTWTEKAGTAIFHFLGLDTLIRVDTNAAQASTEARTSASR